MQCGLSVGKLNLAVNLVQWISMQITLYICKVYTRSLSLPLTWSAFKASEKGYISSFCNVLAQQTGWGQGQSAWNNYIS